VNEATLWQRLGEILAQERDRRQWSLSDVQHHGGPAAATVKTNEGGRIRTVAALDKHARAFGWRLDDLLRLALDINPPGLPPELLEVMRAYEEASDRGRAALLQMASALGSDVRLFRSNVLPWQLGRSRKRVVNVGGRRGPKRRPA
jgi:hypothetical protein